MLQTDDRQTDRQAGRQTCMHACMHIYIHSCIHTYAHIGGYKITVTITAHEIEIALLQSMTGMKKYML